MTFPTTRPVDRSQHSVDSIDLVVNGQSRSIRAGATVADLIRELGLNSQLVAVELNRQLVRKATFSEHPLRDGDRVEIVEFVGGG
jgi:thiamine biosynthesis protein ThiS